MSTADKLIDSLPGELPQYYTAVCKSPCLEDSVVDIWTDTLSPNLGECLLAQWVGYQILHSIMGECLRSVDWEDEFYITDAQYQYTKFITILNSIIEKYMPKFY